MHNHHMSLTRNAARRRTPAFAAWRPRATITSVMILISIVLVALFGVSVILVAMRFNPIPWPI